MQHTTSWHNSSFWGGPVVVHTLLVEGQRTRQVVGRYSAYLDQYRWNPAIALMPTPDSWMAGSSNDFASEEAALRWLYSDMGTGFGRMSRRVYPKKSVSNTRRRMMRRLSKAIDMFENYHMASGYDSYVKHLPLTSHRNEGSLQII
jgi:hypothetical protein